MKPTLQLKLGQTLTMTPQLQQAIRLLQLPVLDLNAQIQEALEENIMLEMEDLPDVPKTDSNTTAEVETIRADEAWQTRAAERLQDGGWNGEGRPITEFADESGQSLRDHLLWQVELEQFSPREELIAETIIDSINDDGYLDAELQEILEILDESPKITEREVEKTLTKIQRLDPIGVGARSLSECIILQLSQLDWETPGLQLAIEVAGEHLDLVATRDYGELRRSLRVSEDDLHNALALIRGCNPRPGNAVSPPAAEYVIPDVFVRKVDNKWQVEISPTGVPRLSVNQQYANLLRGSGEHTVLRSQLQEARWLIRSLEIRNETLLKVATSIVTRQTEFLEHGDEAMKPLVLRDVADEIGMHESTISRVTTNKYMHTPRGVFEFKYFFSSHLASDSGEDQSSTSVRAKIRKLINAEEPAKPLSDSKITNLLKEEGISVARRTVAKYREAMKIPSSSERRKREAR
ncbi:MAG: RNA polymerase factor sigma-54 [Gammaproteobacteria bacterium]|nr:RNA polymerase factor sigma-54 [Gammaproteobacteria bacterium]NNF49629.1 RNA polymerase factor sigma-54 [Woeseiaceae bacterium]MBT8095125.1 RNA polymerase factor sigma-54 [Gammaproteobacteria bacterium]MBT8104601.1 RNA polymerase factor sigma-54 [Gammaproteobacteria bacterium]NNK24615.1 RNA polymerase factor sigma-54 [Woeseiaceae bacterium]